MAEAVEVEAGEEVVVEVEVAAAEPVEVEEEEEVGVEGLVGEYLEGHSELISRANVRQVTTVIEVESISTTLLQAHT